MMMTISLCVVPTGAPQHLSGNAVNSTTILIEWYDVNCTERNGDITEYSIQYESNEYQNSLISTTTMSKSYTAKNLIPFTKYVFTVAAINVNGTGPKQTIQKSTEAVNSESKC